MKSTINDPEHSLPYHLRGAFRGFETALARYLATVGVPISHFHILRLQWDGVGHSQSSIAERAFMTESAASQVMRQLTALGQLRRAVDPEDNRIRLVFLTQKGLELREKLITEGLAISANHAPNLSVEDINTTITVLKEIRRAFDIYNS